MGSWVAAVSGDVSVLGTLANEPGTVRWRVCRDSDGYAIRAPSLDSATSFPEAKEEALGLVAEITGIARLRYGLRVLLKYAGMHFEENGTRAVFVEVPAGEMTVRASVHLAATVIRPDGTVERLDPPSVQIVNVLSTDSRLAALVNAYGDETQDWHGLYKMYERIEKSVPGGRPTLIRAGWVTQKQFENFRKSANDPAVSGDDARHAVSDGYLPAEPMTLDEGRAFIECLLNRLVTEGIPKQ